MWFTRILSSVAFLAAIVFSIPLAFDVGGRTCGLAFSLTLTTYYFIFSILRLSATSASRLRLTLINIYGWLQWLVIPTLLIWSLNKFSVDPDVGGSWIDRTFKAKQPARLSFSDRIFGRDGIAETAIIGSWDKVLRWSTPIFQIAEGFCSLLVIQATGRITKWLVNSERGESWMLGLLVFSASIISSSVYFLWRITTFPQLNNVDAILIGAAITCALFLGIWGIGSGRGNAMESSLLFAYVTLCVYQIFTDYKPSGIADTEPPAQPEFPPLPPILMASYMTVLYVVSNLPSTILSAFSFVAAAIMTLTPSVIISLAYRVFVLYVSARIIPAIRESGARSLLREPSLEDSDEAGQILGFLTWFSPSILISVYTSLLMQHFATTNGESASDGWWTIGGDHASGNVWRWINVACTMVLYAIELTLAREDETSQLTSHWKVD